MKDYLSKIAGQIFGREKTREEDDMSYPENKDAPTAHKRVVPINRVHGRPGHPDIGFLPGTAAEKMTAYQNSRGTSASDQLKGGQIISDALKQIECSTTHANRTKQIFLKSRNLRR